MSILCGSPTISSRRTSSAFGGTPLPWIWRAISRLPRTVRVGNRLNRWKTKPIFCRRTAVRAKSPAAETSTPSTTMRPDVGRARPPRRCRSVDLPQPEGPMIATNSPFWTWMSTPRRACTSTCPT